MITINMSCRDRSTSRFYTYCAGAATVFGTKQAHRTSDGNASDS